MILQNGDPKFIDFGISKLRKFLGQVVGVSKYTVTGITPGYSHQTIEELVMRGEQLERWQMIKQDVYCMIKTIQKSSKINLNYNPNVKLQDVISIDELILLL